MLPATRLDYRVKHHAQNDQMHVIRLDMWADEAKDNTATVAGLAITPEAGRLADALSLVESLLPRRSKVNRQAKHEWVTYLTNNRTRTDDPRYEALGLPIGSGEVEAQCKTWVQARRKRGQRNAA